MLFRNVFIAIVISFGLVVAAFLFNRAPPTAETAQPNSSVVRASGKCAECHSRQQYSIVPGIAFLMGVGLIGFVFHALADLHGPSKNLFENIVDSAPPMAPLLFPNLVLLG